MEKWKEIEREEVSITNDDVNDTLLGDLFGTIPKAAPKDVDEVTDKGLRKVVPKVAL